MPPAVIVDVASFALWLAPAAMGMAITGLAWQRNNKPVPTAKYVASPWLMALLTFVALIGGATYGTWNVFRVYDSLSTIWLAAVALQLCASFVGAVLWAPLFYQFRSPAWAAVVLALVLGAAITNGALYWVLYAGDTVGYTPIGASVYLAYVVFLAYAFACNAYVARK
jgi:hypothetical protein